MELEDVLQRIEARLKALGLSADNASRTAGKPDAIRNMRRAVANTGASRSGISSSTLSALAPVLKTSLSWLLDGTGSEEPSGVVLPIDGLVGAGGEINPDVHLAYEGDVAEIVLDIPVPAGISTYEVWGNSMWPKYDPGDVVLIQKAADPIELLLGEVALVLTNDGNRFLKRILKGSGQGLYDLESFNAPVMKDRRVVEAGMIYVVVPARQVRRQGTKEIARRYQPGPAA